MNKMTMPIVMVMIMILSAFVQANGDAVEVGHDYVTGGDFEGTRDDLKTDFPYQQSSKKIVVMDDKVFTTGKQSVKIQLKIKAPITVGTKFRVDTSSGNRYIKFLCDIKGENIEPGTYWWETVRVWMEMFDESGNPFPVGRNIIYLITPWLSGSYDWRTVKSVALIPKGVAYVQYSFGIVGGKGNAWFDNMHAIDVTEYVQNPREGKNVTVDVDYAKTLRKFPQGFGWNWHLVHDAMFKSDFIDHLKEQIKWDGMDWVRFGVNLEYWAPLSPPDPGDDDGGKLAYNFNNDRIRQYCSVLDSFQQRGIDVLISNWNTGGWGEGRSKWLQHSNYTGVKAVDDPQWFVPYSNERFAEAIAEFLKYMIIDKKYTCIKWVSIWNEPEGPWLQIGKYPNDFYSIYTALKKALDKYGLSGKVGIVGPEGVACLDYAARDVLKYGKELSGLAEHEYAAGLEVATDVFSSMPVSDSMKTISAAKRMTESRPEGAIPLWLTEFGSYNTVVYSGERELYVWTLGSCEYAIRAAAAGIDGILKWCFNEFGRNQYAPFREDGQPVDELYWGYAILTRWTAAGSELLMTSVSGSQDIDGNPRVYAQVFKSPTGEFTVLMTNNGISDKEVRIRLPESKKEWNHYYYDRELGSGIRHNKQIRIENGWLIAALTAESINAFTTFNEGLTGAAPVK